MWPAALYDKLSQSSYTVPLLYLPHCCKMWCECLRRGPDAVLVASLGCFAMPVSIRDESEVNRLGLLVTLKTTKLEHLGQKWILGRSASSKR